VVVDRERAARLWRFARAEPGFWFLAAGAVLLLLGAVVTAALQVH
jgi:hypothetical protein